MASKMVTQSLLGIQNSALTTSVNSEQASEVFMRLLHLVSESPEDYKHQLNHFIYPVFIHLYLDLILLGQKLRALEFYDKFNDVFVSVTGYQEAMKELIKVQSVDDVQMHPYFKLFRFGKYNVRMTENCFDYFLSFLKDDDTNILIELINMYFAVMIRQNDDDESLVYEIMQIEANKTSKLELVENSRLGHSKDKVKENVEKEKLHKSSSSARNDADKKFCETSKAESHSCENAESDNSSCLNILSGIERDIVHNASFSKSQSSQDSVKDVTNGIRNDCHKVKNKDHEYSHQQNVRLDNESAEDILKKMTSLDIAIENVSKLPPYVPPVRSYDVANYTHRSLFDIKISWDEELLASAFDDCSIELCSLSPIPLHSEHKATVQLYYVDKPETTCSVGQIQLLRGHSEAVYGLSFNRHSSVLLSCSGDHTIRAWDMKTYKNVAIYKGHNFPVLDVDYDLFSFRFASASMDGTSRLWDTERTFPLSMLVGHKSGVGCTKFHPNGKYLATGSSDKSVILWHSQEAREMRIFHGHEAEILSLAFSIDGKYLASAGADKTIKIWDIASGKLMSDLKGHESAVYSLCFNSNTSLLASGGLEKHIHIWNMEDCILKNKSSLQMGKKTCEKAGSYLMGSVPTQCSTVQFVRFGRKNLLTSAGLSAEQNS